MTTPPRTLVAIATVAPRHLPAVLARVAARTDARATPGHFTVALGTAGPRFVPADTTPRRWVVVTTCPAGTATGDAAVAWWRARAAEWATLTLRPLWSRGRWRGRAPFGEGELAAAEAVDTAAPVAAITRATLRVRRAGAFYRAVPAVAAAAVATPGLLLALGIGEAPLLRQGTLSVWRSLDAMRAFAHHSPAHAAAVRATPRVGWYGEEMFTRFAVEEATGTVDGRSVA